MCRLLSAGKARAGKGACHLDWGDVEEWNEGLLALLLPDRADAATGAALARTKRIFGARAYMATTMRRRQRDAVRLRDLAASSEERRGGKECARPGRTRGVPYQNKKKKK